MDSSASDREVAHRVSIHLTTDLADGLRTICGRSGEPLLFVLREGGAPISSVCGGKGTCGTCRVQIAEDWFDRLAAPEKREARLLAFTQAGRSDRLACRIMLGAELDGLQLHICSPNQGTWT